MIIQGASLAVLLLTSGCSEAQSSQATSAEEQRAVSLANLPLAGRVTEAAEILDPSEEAKLTSKLAQLESNTRHQLVVVTIPALEGRDVADVTRDLADRWGIGRKGYDDGVVLLVAPAERKARIAVGRGLEHRLPDDWCGSIMDEHMIPQFRAGNMAAGIEAGVDALIAASSHLRSRMSSGSCQQERFHSGTNLDDRRSAASGQEWQEHPE